MIQLQREKHATVTTNILTENAIKIYFTYNNDQTFNAKTENGSIGLKIGVALVKLNWLEENCLATHLLCNLFYKNSHKK